MTKTSQSVIGVRGLFLLGSKRGQLAGYSDEPGRDHISLRCELDTGCCGIMRRYLNANFRFNIHSPDGVPYPPTPRSRPVVRSHELRQHLVVNPERVPGSGFIFMASATQSAQTCLASSAEFAIELSSGRRQFHPLNQRRIKRICLRAVDAPRSAGHAARA
jgi:hypothetical protein